MVWGEVYWLNYASAGMYFSRIWRVSSGFFVLIKMSLTAGRIKNKLKKKPIMRPITVITYFFFNLSL